MMSHNKINKNGEHILPKQQNPQKYVENTSSEDDFPRKKVYDRKATQTRFQTRTGKKRAMRESPEKRARKKSRSESVDSTDVTDDESSSEIEETAQTPEKVLANLKKSITLIQKYLLKKDSEPVYEALLKIGLTLSSLVSQLS